MGVVYRARDAVSGRIVALKLIRGGTDAKSALQFQQEFATMASLRHPNCCEVYDYGVAEDGTPFFTMEIVPGIDLAALPAEPEALRRVFALLLLALGYMHHEGLVHRDLKPENVRITPDGVVKLMDYGLIAHAGASGLPVAGTPATMAPETILRRPIDQRTDLYAVGCMLYWKLAGRPPFEADDVMGVLRAHLDETPRPPSRHRKGVDPALEAIAMRLLAKAPDARHASAEAVLEALGAPVPAGRGGRLLASPLQGRDDVTARLLARLRTAEAGAPAGTLVLEGPSGIGKSRLLAELRVQAQLAGLPIVAGPSHETGTLPYGPLTAALRELLPRLRTAVPDRLAEAAPALLGVLPELDAICGGVEPAPSLDNPANERRRLQGALTGLIAAAAGLGGLVLCLEDWHWADPLSVEALPALLARLAQAPALVVIATRHMADPPPGSEHVALGPLDATALDRMIRAMLGGQAPPAGLIAHVAARSEHNPAHVEALLEHLARTGRLAWREGAWHAALDDADEPLALGSVLAAHAAALPVAAREVARLLAAADGEAPLARLRHAAELEDPAFFAAVATLRREGVVRQDAEGLAAFTLVGYRPAFYDAMPAARRSAAHARLLAAIEAEAAHDEAALAGASLARVQALASQALRAGNEDAAVGYALAAGRRLVRLGDMAAAEPMLVAGLAAARARRAPVDVQVAYMEAIGDMQRYQNRREEAVMTFEQAIALLGPAADPRLRGRLRASLAKACMSSMEGYARARAVVVAACADLRLAGDDEGLARALNTAARAAYMTGDSAPARQLAAEAVEAAERTGSVAMRAHTRAFLGHLEASAGGERRALGEALMRAALADLPAVGDAGIACNVLELAGHAQMARGDFPAAAATFAESVRRAERAGLDEYLHVTRLNQALVAFEQGRPIEAGEAVRAFMRSYATRGFELGVAAMAWLEACLALQRGEPSAFERATLAREALERRRTLGETLLCRQLQADFALAAGSIGEATAAVDALAATMNESGDREAAGRLAGLRAEVALLAGDVPGAAALAAEALALCQREGLLGDELRARRAFAAARLAGRGAADALAAAQAGLEAAERLGAHGQAAELQRLAAQAAYALARPESADGFAEAARRAAAAELVRVEAAALAGLAHAEPRSERGRTAWERATALFEAITAPLPPQAAAALRTHPSYRLLATPPVAAPSPRGMLGWEDHCR